MHPTGSSQATKSHPQIQKHNAETKTATNKLLQQKHKHIKTDCEGALTAASVCVQQGDNILEKVLDCNVSLSRLSILLCILFTLSPVIIK